MRVAAIIAIIFGFVFVALILVLSRYGLFHHVNISEKVAGPYLLVYKKHIGDYKYVGPVMDDIYRDLKNGYSIEAKKGFGLYYDDPRQVDKAQLRSIVGCIVEGLSIEEIDKVAKKYSVKEYPSSKSVVAEFPYKGAMSIYLGIFKVYPELGAYIKERKYNQTPIMELYDQPHETIEYISSVNLSRDVFDEFLKSRE